MWTLGSHPSPSESELAFKQESKVTHVHVKVSEALDQVVCFREVIMRKNHCHICKVKVGRILSAWPAPS